MEETLKCKHLAPICPISPGNVADGTLILGILEQFVTSSTLCKLLCEVVSRLCVMINVNLFFKFQPCCAKLFHLIPCNASRFTKFSRDADRPSEVAVGPLR